MDGLVLWLDASDIDGNGERDSILDQASIPILVRRQMLKMPPRPLSLSPSYEQSGFGSFSVKFSSGQSMKVEF